MKFRSSKFENLCLLWSLYNGRNRVKDDCIISTDWVGVGKGGFQQSSSWVRLFEITRKLEVRNLKIDVHYGEPL